MIYYNYAIKIEEKKWVNHEIWQQFIVEEFIEEISSSGHNFWGK